MARVELIQPYEMQPVGTIIEIPGGLASVLVARRIAKLANAGKEVSEPAQIPTEPVTQSKPKAARRPRSKK